MAQAMQRASLPNHSVILVLLYGPSDCTPEGQVAQLVEHRTENAGVAGSIPALATIRRSREAAPKRELRLGQRFALAIGARWEQGCPAEAAWPRRRTSDIFQEIFT